MKSDILKITCFIIENIKTILVITEEKFSVLD